MLDFIIEILGDIFDWGGDAIESVGKTVAEVASNVDLGDVLLIGSAIYVANLSVSSIRDKLRNRQELKAKGATQVVIKKFFEERDGIRLDLVALNAQNQQVGKFSMKGNSISGLSEGQRIAI